MGLKRLIVTTADGRLFELQRAVPYERRDGTMSSMALWRGACRLCGAPFEIGTSGNLAVLLATDNFSIVHCEAHRLKRGRKALPQPSEGGADQPAIGKEGRNATP